MNRLKSARRLLGAAALLMLPAATTLAVPELRLTPSSYDLIPNAGGGTEEVSFDVLITGLDATTLVAGYDFGIIYDPAHLTLAGFDGFTDRLGDESQFEVYNEDYLGDLNSLWDYRARHETLGDYTGPVVGTPVITGQGVKNEGSLRFTQASYLERDALLALQGYSGTDSLRLFTLRFQVDTSIITPGSQIRFVDDRDYKDFPGSNSLLDVKLSTAADPVGELPNYLPTTGAIIVVVPAPTTWMLILLGLSAAAARRLADRTGQA